MSEMTLSSRHRVRNSNPGGLRPSTLPLSHGGGGVNHCQEGPLPLCYVFTAFIYFYSFIAVRGQILTSEGGPRIKGTGPS